jgi:hypothetical protein
VSIIDAVSFMVCLLRVAGGPGKRPRCRSWLQVYGRADG